MSPIAIFGSEVNVAWRNVIRQRRRSAVAISAVAMGVIALILASGFNEFMFWAFREASIRSQLGHIQIARLDYHRAGRADPHSYLLPDVIPDLKSDSKSHPVKAVAPRMTFGGLISLGDATVSFLGEGVDPLEEAAFGDEPRIVAGTNLRDDGSDGVILGEGLARNIGAGVGSRVVLMATTSTGATSAVELSVLGQFSSVSKAYDDAALRLPIRTARRLTRNSGAHLWVVLLAETEHTDFVLQQLRALLPADKYELVPWYALADYYNKTKVLFAKQLFGLWLVVALIIVLAITNTMMMNVLERTGEVGTSMALGVRRGSVMRGFLYEGLIVGAIGGGIGLAVGFLLAEVISAIGIPMPPPPGKAHGYIAGIMVTTRIVVEALSLAEATALIASLYPAWTASRQPIVDALRHNR